MSSALRMLSIVISAAKRAKEGIRERERERKTESRVIGRKKEEEGND